MSLLSGVTSFFGLDIGTSAIRAVELKGSGPIRVLGRYGQAAVDSHTLTSEAKVDNARLAEAIESLWKQSGITTKNVAVNVPSNRVFTIVIDMDRLPPAELDKTMRYQADSLVPTPLAESKLDWVVLGDSPKDPKKVEVLLSSVPNDFIEGRLNLLESIGLNVVAIEPDSLAAVRSLIPSESMAPQLIVDIGNLNTDLVIVIGGAPRLVRSIAFGTQALIRTATQTLGVEADQAQQYVFKFGLSQEKLDGQIYAAIAPIVESLISEIEKSIKFFNDRYPNSKLDRILVSGAASTIPSFPLYIANRFKINVEIGNAWRNVSYPPAEQNDLMAQSSHFAVASGLAQRDI